MNGPQPNYFVTAKNAAAWNPIGYWLMACYAYEELEHPIMEDAEFDKLCAYIVTNWGDVLLHPHADLIDVKVLASTGSSISATKPMSEWPTMTMDAAHQLMDTIHGKGQWGPHGQSYRDMLAKRFPKAPPPADDYGDLC